MPYFSVDATSKHLKTSSKKLIRNFFEETAYDALLRNARNLSLADMEAQLALIRMTLATIRMVGGPEQPNGPFGPGGSVVPPDRVLSKCVEIGEQLLRDAIVADDHAFWIAIKSIEDNFYGADLAGGELYGGSVGIGIYLAELYRATGQERFREGAEHCLNSVRGLGPINGIAIGAYEGVGSLLYAETRIARIVGDSSTKIMRSRLDAMRGLARTDGLLDVIAGAAGAALAALAASSIEDLADEAIDVARICARRLQETAKRDHDGACWDCETFSQPLTGFAHGTSGIAYALGAVAKATGEMEFAQLAWDALRFERASFDVEQNGWRDLRSIDVFPAAWCHGSAGMTLARQKLVELGLPGAPDMAREIQDGLQSIELRGHGGSHCLCHGTMGNLEPLFRAGGRHAAIAQASIAETMDALDHDGLPRCGVASFEQTPDLMTGIAGVGLGLLRAINPQMPSVLLVEA